MASEPKLDNCCLPRDQEAAPPGLERDRQAGPRGSQCSGELRVPRAPSALPWSGHCQELTLQGLGEQGGAGQGKVLAWGWPRTQSEALREGVTGQDPGKQNPHRPLAQLSEMEPSSLG